MACAALASSAAVALAAASRSSSKRSFAAVTRASTVSPPYHSYSESESDNASSVCSTDPSDVDSNENVDYDASDGDAESDDGAEKGVIQGPSLKRQSGKLWTRKQFPEGTRGHQNWDMSNLIAAQKWKCPCADRANCIGDERLKVLDLYEHRKQFRCGAPARNGYRDSARDDMAQRYDRQTKTFTRSFKVLMTLHAHLHACSA